jgi:sulfofructosephosphate aldolase
VTLSRQRHAAAMAAVARPSGAFAMVAIDQRESLRAMFAENVPEPISLERRVAFKVAVARILSPHASALLVDRWEGMDPILEAEALHPDCALIVAADELVQPIGGVVEDTRLDRSVDLVEAAARGAVAAKLLVIWRPDRPEAGRSAFVRDFLSAARGAGLLGIVEGVVRPQASADGGPWADREEALIEAARELGSHGPDLYKAQVPFDGLAAASDIEAACRRIGSVLRCPWVVLSSGVPIDAFPAAVEAAARGGASGFLAGRAVWRDALTDDPVPLLSDRSVPRLRRLAAIVDAHAVPWPAAAGSG